MGFDIVCWYEHMMNEDFCFIEFMFLVELFTRFKNGDGVNFRERSRNLEREAGK